MRPGLSFAELADLGVRRISIGRALARVMWASAISAARELKEGRFDVLGSGIPGASLDAMFRSLCRRINAPGEPPETRSCLW
jgi:2-methylisocitrate lyase-like PEP mutase family enzyme